MKDLIVIGAGTAGLTAALYAARAGKSVLIFEKEGIGGQIATTPIVENYPGIQSISGIEFADGLYEQVLALGVELEVDEVLKIEPQKDHHKVISSTKEYVSKAVKSLPGVGYLIVPYATVSFLKRSPWLL